jgi:hypothetical protein
MPELRGQGQMHIFTLAVFPFLKVNGVCPSNSDIPQKYIKLGMQYFDRNNRLGEYVTFKENMTVKVL